MRFYLRSGGQLSAEAPSDASAFDKYVSDPRKPVPFVEKPPIAVPAEYMDGDQRFAESRPDVLTYATAPLEADLTVAGPIAPALYVGAAGATNPISLSRLLTSIRSNPAILRTDIKYDQRGEPFRGKFRGSFESPRPFTPEVRN